MKLFNAQSENKQAEKVGNAVVLHKDLESKVLLSNELLVSVAGGFNPVKTTWPPVEDRK